MTQEEKKSWLQDYLKNCLGEELPNIQDIYTFGNHKIGDDEVLADIPTIILNGRVIHTINLDTFLTASQNIEVLTKESFGVMCSNNPAFKDWYIWTLDRKMIEI